MRIQRKKPATTLIELLVATAILSIGILVLAETFKYIQIAIQSSKNKTIATNLAQEKMQILKQKSYYNILPTTAPLYLSDFDPPLPYDNYFFPPENILEAGVNYTRYVYIQAVREDSGEIVILPPTTPDTGMKMITITIVWDNRGTPKKIQIKSLIANPDTVMSNCVVRGRIWDSSTLSPIENAVVNIAENQGFRDTSDLTGNYSITLNPGDYTLSVQARGYFPVLKSVSVAANETKTEDFSLIKMDTGTITGCPWLRTHLVISQVVGSSENAAGYDQEYVEIFNPTTYTWTVNGEIGLKFQRIYDSQRKEILIDYYTDYISSESFYLFANTTTVMVKGVAKNADAVWSDFNTTADFPYFGNQHNIIPVLGDGTDEGGGALELYQISSGKTMDMVGWNRNNGASGKKTAPFYETNPIPQNAGLQENEQYVRYSSTEGVSLYYGPAYDSNDNSVDFYVYSSSVSVVPRNSSNTLTVISGTPAGGAVVSCSDGLSSAATAYLTGNVPYAEFTMIDVATGAWSVIISSSGYSLLRDTVTIASAGDVYVFPSTSTFLDTEISWGYITGKVTDVSGSAIIPAIAITNYTFNTTANTTNGSYTLMVSTGYNTVVANPNNENPNYVSISSQNVFVGLGEIKSGLDFILYQGARISGFLTRDGVNALPGVPITVSDSNNAVVDQQTSDNSGRFTTNVISTGTYTVTPIVDSKETVSPSTYSVTLSAPGLTVFSATFTVSNALGYIQGSVSYQGEPVKTGVLIVVTTTTLSGSPPEPPDLDYSALTGPPFYLTSSNENGAYLIEARESTGSGYNVYAYYFIPGETTCTIVSSSTVNIQVIAGQKTTGVDFSW